MTRTAVTSARSPPWSSSRPPRIIFHIGNSRIYRLSGNTLEQLTNDHRIVISSQQSYLGRALGVNPQIEIDYQMLRLEPGDVFVLATDGIYEHLGARAHGKGGERGRRPISKRPRRRLSIRPSKLGSEDNLTVQIVRVDGLPDGVASEVFAQPHELPLPPLLEARAVFDGYRIVRELHGSSRSHIYLAVDIETDAVVTIKIPSIDLRDDPAYLKRFMMEEWVARRIDSPHVLKPCLPQRKRNFLYVVDRIHRRADAGAMDDRQSKAERWRPCAASSSRLPRACAPSIARRCCIRTSGPTNIMIDTTGTVKIIDFGSTMITGVVEAAPSGDRNDILGTQQYTAPEYFLGEPATSRSDLFSLGVITYQMLTGKLPYGTQIANARTRSQFNGLVYRPASHGDREVPQWIDGTLEKAVHPNPYKRYDSFSEFLFDLRHPNANYLSTSSTPLIERNPLLFWKSTTIVLALAVIVLLAMQHGMHR